MMMIEDKEKPSYLLGYAYGGHSAFLAGELVQKLCMVKDWVVHGAATDRVQLSVS
jgi:hypothetical protein